jgi:hypothetical protein
MKMTTAMRFFKCARTACARSQCLHASRACSIELARRGGARLDLVTPDVYAAQADDVGDPEATTVGDVREAGDPPPPTGSGRQGSVNR